MQDYRLPAGFMQVSTDHPSRNPSDTPRLVRLVALCAGASLLLYLLLPGLVASLTSSELSHAWEVFPWVKNLANQPLSEVQGNVPDMGSNLRFLACCALLFVIYGYVLHRVKESRSLKVQAVIFGTGAVFMLSELLSPVMLSTDVFAYAFYGRVLSVYDSNAYATDLHLSADPFLVLFGHQYVGSVYGPLWTIISAVLARIGGDHVGLVVLLFRGFSVLAALGAGALIWNFLRVHSPGKATQGLALFVWNPLVIIETGLSGHNDDAMISLALLGVWLHLRGWKTGAVVAFTLSALVKFLTGMFIPLYMLMVLRGIPGWKNRAFFVGKSAVCAGMVMAVVMTFARVKSDVPAAPYATAADFYSNNFHELIFKGIRRMLGEDAESVQVPVYFGSWWITTENNIDMRDIPSDHGKKIVHIAKSRNIIVIAPHRDDWMRVYDPVTRKKGYVSGEMVADTAPDPEGETTDPVLAVLEDAPVDWPTVILANKWIRIATWGLFATFGLLAAWKTTDFERFLFWAPAALLASYFLIMTQMWPWYMIWALAFGALKPGNSPARLAAMLSAGMLTLYVTIGCASGDHDWINTFRSVPAIVLPSLLFLAGTLIPRLSPPGARSWFRMPQTET